MIACKKYFIILILLVFNIALYGQRPSKKIIRNQVEKLFLSLKNSDTTLFKSLIVKINMNCNNENLDFFILDPLFEDCKAFLDTIIRENIAIDNIKIEKEKWQLEYENDKKSNTIYLVCVEFKNEGKRKKGIEFYFFKDKGIWLIDYQIARVETTYH